MTVRVDTDADGLRRCRLDGGRGNILDIATLQALTAAIPGPDENVLAVAITAEGSDFCFGSSIEDHRPQRIEASLDAFSKLLRALVVTPAPVIGVVQGRCLGGGFELILACDLVVVEEGCALGLPELQLGVFPPIAAALLPARVGSARTAELVLTPHRLGARDAVEWGLANRAVAPGAGERVLADWRAGFAGTSRLGLRMATLASRSSLRRAVEQDLGGQIARYLDRLCGDPDGFEGIEAFLAKRPPRWSDGP